MITASHNPYRDNGLKFFSGQGLKISPEEENKIEDLFFNYDFDNFKIKQSNYGKAIRLKNAIGRYSEALKQSADRDLNYSKYFKEGNKYYNNFENYSSNQKKLLNIDFCGVDIIEHNQKYYVIEVNSIPAWKGLQKVESANISEYFTNLFK